MGKLPELLAPAGDESGIIAAIHAGADAVYFGGKKFNARQRASNIEDQEMTHNIRLCHQNGVKAYLTLNILIKECEWPSLLDYLSLIATTDIDGIIVQDPGLIWFLRKWCPEISLQTSTQASIGGLYGVKFFEDMGFTRVVLPREMSMDDVVTIKNQTKVELKIFCHGALCYARSGQCLLSSFIGGRSGNRGLCAQPCRKQYVLKNNKGQHVAQGYLLSMKDLNTKEHLNEIVKSGVSALKIEGRLKNPEYIYAVTKAYRDQLDDIYRSPQTEHTKHEDIMGQVFNRSFTPGHLFERSGFINPVIQKNRGTLIGRVVSYANRQITIQLKEGVQLSVGDGLAFGESAQKGIRVDKIKSIHGQIVVPCHFKIELGTSVYRNNNSKLNTFLEKKVTEPLEFKKIPMRLQLNICENQSVFFEIFTGEKREQGFIYDCIPEKAKKHALNFDIIFEQLSKLGDTDYYLEHLDLKMEDNLFLSKGQLNALRREIIQKIETPKSRNFIEKFGIIHQETIKRVQHAPLISVQIREIDQVFTLGYLPVDQWVIPIDDPNDLNTVKSAIQKIKSCHQQVLLAFPKVMNTACCARFSKIMNQIRTLNIDGYLASNYESLMLLKGEDKFIEADSTLHFFNSVTSHALKAWGCRSGVLSNELDIASIREIVERSVIPCTLSVFGYQEAMISDNCIFQCANDQCEKCQRTGNYWLEDEQKKRFPVWKDHFGMIHIYNADKLFLRKELEKIQGISNYRIKVYDENASELEAVIGGYKHGFCWTMPLLGTHYRGRYTKGNFLRGVE